MIFNVAKKILFKLKWKLNLFFNCQAIKEKVSVKKISPLNLIRYFGNTFNYNSGKNSLNSFKISKNLQIRKKIPEK